MGLFGLGTKRKPAPQPDTRPRAPKRPASSFAPLGMPTGVEVSECELDDEDFSTLFGEESRFSETAYGDDLDPWTRRRRRD